MRVVRRTMHCLDLARRLNTTEAVNAMSFRLIRFILAVLFVVVFVTTTVGALFDFHYPRGIDNDPLLDPHQVHSVQGKSLHLEDGRVILLYADFGQLKELMGPADCRVDLEMDRSGRNVSVFVKTRFAECGDPFAMVRWLLPPYCIPLFPDDYSLNYRDCIGEGRFMENHDNLTAHETR